MCLDNGQTREKKITTKKRRQRDKDITGSSVECGKRGYLCRMAISVW